MLTACSRRRPIRLRGREAALRCRPHGSRHRANHRFARRIRPVTIAPEPNSFRSGPDERGRFGIFGGRFVAETLMPLVLDLERAYGEARSDPAYRAEMDGLLKNYVGRPSPLYFAERLTQHLGGARIYLKRE